MADEKGSDGFSDQYWRENYDDPGSMDGIGNAVEHAAYLKYFFAVEDVTVNSVIDLGAGIGHLFKEVLKKFKPYRAMAIEPSRFAYEKLTAIQKKDGFASKVKLRQTDIYSWCSDERAGNKSFDLGICTSVFQYLTDAELEAILPQLAQRVKFLYFSVPTDRELRRQVSELEFCDHYAIRRSKTVYRKMISRYFTFISARVLESKKFFSEDSTPFTDLLYRF